MHFQMPSININLINLKRATEESDNGFCLRETTKCVVYSANLQFERSKLAQAAAPNLDVHIDLLGALETFFFSPIHFSTVSLNI